MPCERIKAWMSDHLDGRLDAARVRDLNAHLAGCEACRREWNDLRQTVALIRSLTPLAPPVDLVDSVRQGLAASRPTRLAVFWRVLNRPQIRVALAASVVILVGFYGWRNLTISPVTPEECVSAACRQVDAPAVDTLADAMKVPPPTVVGKDQDLAPRPADAPVTVIAPVGGNRLEKMPAAQAEERHSLQRRDGIWEKRESSDPSADEKRQPPGLSIGDASLEREEPSVVTFAARAQRMPEAVTEPVAAAEERAVAFEAGADASDDGVTLDAAAAPSVAKRVAKAPLASRMATDVHPLQREIVLTGGDPAAARQILARYVVRAKTREMKEGYTAAASRVTSSDKAKADTAGLSGWINAADYDRLLADLKVAGTVTFRPVEPSEKDAQATPASESGRVWVSIILPPPET
ncbi:MAG: hypothetical protein FJ222_02265 [Lentisphaerae bacterium]|nr:hypothetical protein [Lentisphaerota bacterium]